MKTFLSHHLMTSDKHHIHCDHYKNGHDQVVIIAHGFFNSKDALLLKELGDSLIGQSDIIIMDFAAMGKAKDCFTGPVRNI